MILPQLDAPIKARDLDAIVAFLPRLQLLEPNSAARWPGLRQIREHEFEIDRGETHPAVTELIQALYHHGFVRNFDWPKWQRKALSVYNNPELIKKATMRTCIKLLTLHARKDHFVDCHFAAMVQSGHIAAILDRMAELISRRRRGPAAS